MAALAYRKAYPYRSPNKPYRGALVAVQSGNRTIRATGKVRTISTTSTR